MIKLRVLEILNEKGKTKYWLYKQLGMSYQNFSNMVNNQTKSIRYENIETLCLLFDCSPNDLFEITEEQDCPFGAKSKRLISQGEGSPPFLFCGYSVVCSGDLRTPKNFMGIVELSAARRGRRALRHVNIIGEKPGFKRFIKIFKKFQKNA